MRRDSLHWWFGIIGGAVVAVAGNFHMFPWIPETAQHWLSLAAFVYAIVSGKMASSPLPAKLDVAETMAESSPPIPTTPIRRDSDTGSGWKV